MGGYLPPVLISIHLRNLSSVFQKDFFVPVSLSRSLFLALLPSFNIFVGTCFLVWSWVLSRKECPGPPVHLFSLSNRYIALDVFIRKCFEREDAATAGVPRLRRSPAECGERLR